MIDAEKHIITNERFIKPDLASTEIKAEELIEQRLKAELRHEDVVLNVTHPEVAAFTHTYIPFCRELFGRY